MIIGVLFLGFEKQTGQGHLFPNKQLQTISYKSFLFFPFKDVKGNGFRVHRWDMLFFSFFAGPRGVSSIPAAVSVLERRAIPAASSPAARRRRRSGVGRSVEPVWWVEVGGELQRFTFPQPKKVRFLSLLFLNRPTPRNPRTILFVGEFGF